MGFILYVAKRRAEVGTPARENNIRMRGLIKNNLIGHSYHVARRLPFWAGDRIIIIIALNLKAILMSG